MRHYLVRVIPIPIPIPIPEEDTQLRHNNILLTYPALLFKYKLNNFHIQDYSFWLVQWSGLGSFKVMSLELWLYLWDFNDN